MKFGKNRFFVHLATLNTRCGDGWKILCRGAQTLPGKIPWKFGSDWLKFEKFQFFDIWRHCTQWKWRPPQLWPPGTLRHSPGRFPENFGAIGRSLKNFIFLTSGHTVRSENGGLHNCGRQALPQHSQPLSQSLEPSCHRLLKFWIFCFLFSAYRRGL